MRSSFFALLLSSVALLTSCSDGTSYISVSWVNTPQYYSDENPALPETVINERYYPTGEGTFYYEYTAWDGSGWTGYYSIYVNSNFLFISGDDNYFELALYSFGPSFYDWGDGSYNKSLSAPTAEASQCEYDEAVNAEICYEEVTKGNTTATLAYWPTGSMGNNSLSDLKILVEKEYME